MFWKNDTNKYDYKKEQDYQVIYLDSLMIAIKQIFLELEINNKSKIGEISKR